MRRTSLALARHLGLQYRRTRGSCSRLSGRSSSSTTSGATTRESGTPLGPICPKGGPKKSWNARRNKNGGRSTSSSSTIALSAAN